MINTKHVITFLLIFVLLTTTLLIPVFAIDYLPGVKAGQYVTYSNFTGTGPGLETYNDNDWIKYDIIDVSENLVTMFLTGAFKNGTPIPGNQEFWVYDVQYGAANSTYDPHGPIKAANLSKGWEVAIKSLDKVNDTQTRTYLGETRTVNIFTYTGENATEDSTSIFTYIYDQQSGMLLEMQGKTTQNQANPIIRQVSYSIKDTNIFGAKAAALNNYIYIAVAAAAIAAVVLTGIVLKRRKRKTRRRR